jgi:hypothetical protein
MWTHLNFSCNPQDNAFNYNVEVTMKLVCSSFTLFAINIASFYYAQSAQIFRDLLDVLGACIFMLQYLLSTEIT